MNITNTLKMTGVIHLKLFDKDGRLLSSEVISNLAMNAGKVSVAKLIGGLTSLYVRYMAIGTDATAAAATQTALLAEITTNGGSRTTVSPSSTTTTITNDTVQFVSTWTFTGAFAIKEIGLFDAAVAGNMFARQVVDKSVSSGQTLQATWSIAIS